MFFTSHPLKFLLGFAAVWKNKLLLTVPHKWCRGESLAEKWHFVLTDSLDTMQKERKEVKNCGSSSAVCLQPIVVLQTAFLLLQAKWFAHSLEGKQLLQVTLKHVYDLISAVILTKEAKLHVQALCSGAKTCILSPVKKSIHAVFQWRQVLGANLKRAINFVQHTAQSLETRPNNIPNCRQSVSMRIRGKKNPQTLNLESPFIQTLQSGNRTQPLLAGTVVQHCHVPLLQNVLRV